MISGSAGFFLGCVFAGWLAGIETAQILAKVVSYPPTTPQYLNHIRVFTLQNHLGALLIHILGSERWVCLAFSGLMGMLSFQAISLFIYAINRSVALAFLGCFFIFLFDRIGAGPVYPIALLDSPHNFGVIGLSFTLLTVALFGAGLRRAAFFCLGLAPYVHPSWGCFLFLIVVVPLLWDRWRSGERIRRDWAIWLIAGIAVTLAGYGYQHFWLRDVPSLASEESRAYLSAFINNWDYHRTPFFYSAEKQGLDPFKTGITYCVWSAGFAVLCFRLLPKHPGKILFRILLVAAIASLFLGFLTHLPQSVVPSLVSMLMPGRYANLSNLALFALVLALLTSPEVGKFRGSAVICLLLILAAPAAGLAFAIPMKVQYLLAFLWFGCLAFFPDPMGRILGTAKGNGRLLISAMGAVLLVLVSFNLAGFGFAGRELWPQRRFLNRIETRLPPASASSPGLLLITTDFWLAQLQTRRPVLFDPSALDGFAMIPEAGPLWNRFMKNVYGADILRAPPQEFRNKGQIPNGLYRGLWEKRTREEWGALADEFGFTEVLTGADWALDLPVAIRGSGYVLYAARRTGKEKP